ncbi:hypothetical protein Rsub_09656 [Raphidocelis subcapitata]|uniref:CUE domain-containing protein n=1 Tax=Raphidocelis subcapitata TaxID=307507 RepID=A0A2V0PFW3_9CHLO|nr:hypothetical protein Rsub_09656 [Raphidocelis subcapitata]|eukprot:GBF96800.1 hypothetical protein Rsub_09656 [Raphidocelis subcapitata]
MGRRTFLPFLPADNAELSDLASRAALEAINEDLGQLLRLSPGDFWAAVLSDDRSLHDCLDSFLRFKRRGFDGDADGVAGAPSRALAEVSRRVFMVFLRMVSDEPGPGAPPPARRAAEIYDRWLLDFPKMLDLAAIYGPSNPALAARLVARAFEMQPRYWGDAAAAAEPLAGNLRELRASCGGLAAKALAGGGAELCQEVAERTRYFLDALLTLLAFLDACPAAAALLLLPGRGELLATLAALHDGLAPALERLSRQPGAAAKGAPPAAAAARLRRAAAALAGALLEGCYCGAGAAAALGAAAAAGAGGAAEAAAAAADPDARGQDLMAALMLAAHSGDAPGDGDGDGGAAAAGHGGLLPAANAARRLDLAVSEALRARRLALDDAQFDYLLALLGSDRSRLDGGRPAPAAAGQGGGASAAGGGGEGGSGSGGPGAARVAELVTQVREVLPDYGAGFVTACLYHCGWDAERVLHTLLEGAPPPAVAALGLAPSLAAWSPPGGGSGGGGGGGGASGSGGAGSSGRAGAAAAAEGGAAAAAGGTLSWAALAHEARAADAAAAAAAASAIASVPVPAAAPRARAAAERRTARVLGARSDALRSATKSLADQYQWEEEFDPYDDEYDDALDELINLKNDGVCDAEGEETDAEAAARRARAGGGGGGAAGPSAAGGRGGGGPGPGPGRGPAAGRGRGRGAPKSERLWVLDGKIYNYKKAGAQEVAGREGAEKALEAAEAAAHQIHGLGPGGNVPLAAAPQWRQQQEQEQQQRRGGGEGGVGGQEAGPSGAGGGQRQQQPQQQQYGGGGRGGGGRGGDGGGRGGGGGRAGGREGGGGRGGGRDGGGGRGGGRGGGEGEGEGGGDARRHAYKEAHKSAIANHHRKDRALRKQGLL